MLPSLALAWLLPLAAPTPGIQVPESHLGGEIVLELRQPEAFWERLGEHGIPAILADEEMSGLLARLGPWLGRHLEGLDVEMDDHGFRLALGPDGLPRLELSLPEELDAILADEGLQECPDAVALALDLSGLRQGGGEPRVIFSVHWGERSLAKVRGAAEKLLLNLNGLALERGSEPLFSAASFEGTEVWRVGEPDGDEALYAAFDEGAMVLSLDRTHLVRTVRGEGPRVHPVLGRLRAEAGTGSLVAFADLKPLVQLGLAEEGREAAALASALGIDSWSWLVATLRPEGPGLRVRGHLEADGTRGLLGALNRSLPAAELFAGVPAGSQAALAVALDPSELFADFRRLHREIEPRAAAEADEAIAEAGREIGMPVEELIGLFGDRAAFSVRLRSESVPAPPDLFLEVGLRSPESGQQLQSFVLRTAEAHGAPLEAVALDEAAQAWRLPVHEGPFQPVFTVTGNRLRVASSPLALNLWLRDDLKPSGMQDALASLSHGSTQEVTGILALDTGELVAFGYGLLRPILAAGLAGLGEEVPIDASLLPSPDLFRRHLPPTLRAFQVHDRGLDFESYGIF